MITFSRLDKARRYNNLLRLYFKFHLQDTLREDDEKEVVNKNIRAQGIFTSSSAFKA